MKKNLKKDLFFENLLIFLYIAPIIMHVEVRK